MIADPQRPDWVTDEVLAEFEDEFLAELAERLIAGGRGDGLALSAAECRVLAELVVKRPKRKRAVGRPDATTFATCPCCSIACISSEMAPPSRPQSPRRRRNSASRVQPCTPRASSSK